MAYVTIDNEQVWQDEPMVKHLIKLEDGTMELRDSHDNLPAGAVCLRELQASKKEHCTEVYDNGCIMTVDVDETWETENRPAPTSEEKLEAIRLERNRLLAESDWTQMADSPLYANEAWLTYRQALRDLPETVDVDNPIYPTKPAI